MANDFDHGVNDLVDREDYRNIQPHLGSLEFKEASALEQINPAFEDDDTDTGFRSQTFPTKFESQSVTTNFKDDKNQNSAKDHTNGDTQKFSSSENSSYPVVFNNGGQTNVVQEQVVIKKPDGSKVINTEACSYYASHPYQKRQRPLTKNRILLLKILSVFAVIIYFPLGIPAAYFAFNIQKEFDAGIMIGNIDKAQKYAGRAQKFIIFSGIFAILTLVIVVSIVERFKASDDDNSKMTNRLLPG